MHLGSILGAKYDVYLLRFVMFRVYMEGKTTNTIASILAQRNFPTLGGKKRWPERILEEFERRKAGTIKKEVVQNEDHS